MVVILWFRKVDATCCRNWKMDTIQKFEILDFEFEFRGVHEFERIRGEFEFERIRANSNLHP